MAYYKFTTQEEIDLFNYEQYLIENNPMFVGEKTPLIRLKTFKEMFGYEIKL